MQRKSFQEKDPQFFSVLRRVFSIFLPGLVFICSQQQGRKNDSLESCFLLSPLPPIFPNRSRFGTLHQAAHAFPSPCPGESVPTLPSDPAHNNDRAGPGPNSNRRLQMSDGGVLPVYFSPSNFIPFDTFSTFHFGCFLSPFFSSSNFCSRCTYPNLGLELSFLNSNCPECVLDFFKVFEGGEDFHSSVRSSSVIL